MLSCLSCGSENIKKNGHIHTGKQNYYCKDCGRNFVEHCQQKLVSEQEKALIDKLLLERISLRGICQVVSVSLPWLLGYAKKKYEEIPEDLGFCPPEPSAALDVQVAEIEANEMWTFVGKKSNKQWLWLVSLRQSRQIIAHHIGGRGRESAIALWEKIPDYYRQQGLFYTDDWEAYQGVIPERQHPPSKKKPKRII